MIKLLPMLHTIFTHENNFRIIKIPEKNSCRREEWMNECEGEGRREELGRRELWSYGWMDG